MSNLLFRADLNLYSEGFDSLMVEILELNVFMNSIFSDYDQSHLYELVEQEISSNIYEYISELIWPTDENPQSGLLILGDFHVNSNYDGEEPEEWAELNIKEKYFYSFDEE